MAVHGYVTHAARSRRSPVLLLLVLYVLAFELIGAFALTLFLIFIDPEHTFLTNPSGYALRYALPIAGLSACMFWRLYRGHAGAVRSALHVREVIRSDEPRFLTIAEEVCTTLGVRLPRFGLIEAPERNALTVGEGPNAGLMIVTRGLLDGLDDDELAAVLAHEASHIRQCDTRLFAANHALMRTALLWQVHNPLRLEDWRQLLLVLFLPPMLVLMLAGNAVTMASLALAKFARRGIKLSRDHVADGEAIRVTHFPEALLSALVKVAGRSGFVGSHRVEGLLFDGPADHEGGTHPSIEDRRKAITTLGRTLFNPTRERRDSRPPSRPAFGRQLPTRRNLYPTDANGRPLQLPPTRTLKLLALRFSDRDAYDQWVQATIAWYEWRSSDRRNLLGITPHMVIPLAAVSAFLLVFWWPSDGDLSKLGRTFGPGTMIEIARKMNSGPFCEGPSYLDGHCRGDNKSSAQLAVKSPVTKVQGARSLGASTPPVAPDTSIFLFIVLAMVVGVFSPKLMKRLAGVVDATPEQLGATRLTPLDGDLHQAPATPPVDRPSGFGRKRR